MRKKDKGERDAATSYQDKKEIKATNPISKCGPSTETGDPTVLLSHSLCFMTIMDSLPLS